MVRFREKISRSRDIAIQFSASEALPDIISDRIMESKYSAITLPSFPNRLRLSKMA